MGQVPKRNLVALETYLALLFFLLSLNINIMDKAKVLDKFLQDVSSSINAHQPKQYPGAMLTAEFLVCRSCFPYYFD